MNKNIIIKKQFTPADLLLPYQRAWVNDRARFKFGLMARQVGKDFAAGFEGIADCVLAECEGRTIVWIIATPSERQSLESLQKWKEWAEMFHLAIANYEELRQGGGETLLQRATITFPNGSRVIALPGNPNTVRCLSGNVLYSEFAWLTQQAAYWRALFASISNPLRGPKKIRIITTPNGLGDMTSQIWKTNYKPMDHGKLIMDPAQHGPAIHAPSSMINSPIWSCHFVDIYAALKQGLPVNIEQLRAGMNDPEGWAQEFECQFIDVQSTLLPYELIAACESPEAREHCPPEFWFTRPAWPLVMGLDFGRFRDLTVAWVLGRLGDVWQTMEVLVLDKMPTDRQVEILHQRIKQCSRVCLDYTGSGVGLGDYLVKEHRPYDPDKHQHGKIELCHFSNTLKVDIFSKLRMAFEKRAVRVPVSRSIREDLHSVNRVCTPTGGITYRAPYSADGHADRCTALALALRAAGDGPARCSIESVPRRPGPNDMGLGRASRRQCPL